MNNRMKIINIILICIFKFCLSQNTDQYFEEVNSEITKFNAIAANLTWASLVDPRSDTAKAWHHQRSQVLWQDKVCKHMELLHQRHALNVTQERQAYLLCSGQKYTYDEVRRVTELSKELQTIYSEINICIPSTVNIAKNNVPAIEDAILNYISVKNDNDRIHGTDKHVICLKGEKDFEKMMQISKNEEILKWVWLKWREKLHVMRKPFEELVNIENMAALKNGYTDVGESWRDKLEMPDLQQLSRQLYKKIKPLYILLHGVVRFYLRRQYGDLVPEKGLIPAHLLGDLSGQKWDYLTELIAPGVINLDERVKKMNWTVNYVVSRADDFYMSLGLPRMPRTFWQNSIFTDQNNANLCHGAAADMYRHGDVRISYCSDNTYDDLRVLYHEMGHIHYFMAYQNQPGLFRQANSALHESIGDAITNGVIVPQHLHRIRLINDTELYSSDQNYIHNITTNAKIDEKLDKIYFKESNGFVNENTDNAKVEHKDKFTISDILILKQALNKLPQIPYSLAIEEYRWKYFKGTLDKRRLNEEFWYHMQELLGIAPPIDRGENYFDVGAEYHVPNNTPLIRYFLSAFLQHQIFESLCKGTVFGRRNVNDKIPDSIIISQCDVYGSKIAGKILKDLMSRGNSQHWQDILKASIDENTISATPLLRYYLPLQNLLLKLIEKHRIPISW